MGIITKLYLQSLELVSEHDKNLTEEEQRKKAGELLKDYINSKIQNVRKRSRI